jgi:ABC-2 type transport system permease protein
MNADNENVKCENMDAQFLVGEMEIRNANAFSASITFFWRAMLKIKYSPFQLFDVTIFPIMITVMFTFLFGGAISGSPESYIQFLLPGIMVQAVLFVTVYTGISINSDISNGIYNRIRSMPIWAYSPIAGALLGDLLRYLVVMAVVMAFGLLMGFRPEGNTFNIFFAFVLLLFFALSISWLWIIVGICVKSAESVMSMSFLVLFPLTFTSNIFVDPETMPSLLQMVVNYNPVTHMVTAFRGLIHGDVYLDYIILTIIASVFFSVILSPVAIKLYHRER